jgi:hypothetical protein
MVRHVALHPAPMRNPRRAQSFGGQERVPKALTRRMAWINPGISERDGPGRLGMA